MFIVTVVFNLKQGATVAFMLAMRRQALLSVEREPDCHLFDVCIDPENETRVLLYEHYTDRASFDAHLASGHFHEFDASVAPLVQEKQVNFWRLEEHAA
jgi:quinol monooxygenase YgiN